MNLKERADKLLSKVQAHYYPDLEVKSGKGSYVYGLDGRKILDFSCGVAVTSTGHCHPKVVAAIAKQAKNMIHNCIAISYHPTAIEYMEALQKVVPIKDARFFLCQSGSEAIEGALKVAKYVSGKSGIIALKGGFHGRTIGALSITSSKKLFQEGYGDLVPNSFFADYSIESIAAANNGNIAAVITELVRGEGGYAPHEIKFIQDLRKYCTQNNIFLIIDEVQTGFLRTGKMFASEWYRIEPDIMAISKAIASGLPLGAVVMKKEISDKWSTSAHGGTFLGNLIACAAGSATLDVLASELPKMPKKIDILHKEIDKLITAFPKIFISRQGVGFMQGLVCADGQTCGKLRTKALQLGLLLLNSGANGEVIRLVPPVTISAADLRKGFKILAEAARTL
jgi:4-aminobutyrate aminotransferase